MPIAEVESTRGGPPTRPPQSLSVPTLCMSDKAFMFVDELLSMKIGSYALI